MTTVQKSFTLLSAAVVLIAMYYLQPILSRFWSVSFSLTSETLLLIDLSSTR